MAGGSGKRGVKAQEMIDDGCWQPQGNNSVRRKEIIRGGDTALGRVYPPPETASIEGKAVLGSRKLLINFTVNGIRGREGALDQDLSVWDDYPHFHTSTLFVKKADCGWTYEVAEAIMSVEKPVHR